MAGIPIRLAPLPGEALDSWLGAYADLLHVTVRDIFRFAGIDCGRAGRGQLNGKPLLHQLAEPELAALSAATGVPAQTLAGMTLARYHGTGLAARPGTPPAPRWWRQPSGSRYCPRCLAANGGRWMLAWRIPWAFACAGCQALLADACPDCGRRHHRTRPGRPREPGRCDLAGLPLPPWHPPAGTPACGSDPAATPSAALPAGGHVLTAQQHVDAVIAALLSAQGRPAEAAVLRQYLDDACAVARAAISAAGRTVGFPAAVTAVLDELGARTGPMSAFASPPRSPPRQLAPLTAFGVTVADIMLHGRPGDPDPVIAGWLAADAASRGQMTCPGQVPIIWSRASPALQASLAGPLAAQADTVRQLRYRAVAGPARIPDPARGRERAAAVPSLMWPGWALRLLPPQGRGFQRSRALLAVMLAVAVTGEEYGTAARLLGLEPSRLGKLGNFTALLRQHGALEPVTAAICQLARNLDQHGAPVIDYARRRRQGSLCQAPLDAGSWRSQRDLLPAQHDRPGQHTPAQEQLARLRLIELLTGTHPRYLPGPLQLPRQRGPDYAAFVLTMPGQLNLCLRRQASELLSQAGISEPVTWEPPPGWAPDIPPPGPDPDAASAEQRIRRLLAIPGQPSLQHAARQLGTTTARLARQVRQLEDAIGTALLRTGPDGLLTLTAYGHLLARDVRPVLEPLEQPRESDNHGTVTGAQPSWGHDDQGHQPQPRQSDP
jgi:molybdenum-dependent DNA-binding transcriptional regulator ModE